jgi:hypothetical protein
MTSPTSDAYTNTTPSLTPNPPYPMSHTGAKVKTKHLGYWKKVKGFGECAKTFMFSEGKDPNVKISVQVTQRHPSH